MAKTIAKALGRQDVQAVMNRHGLVLKDIELFYQRFEIHSLPPNLREMAVCNANMLDYFFVNSTPAEVAGEYVRNIEDQNVVINLTLWAKHNPGGLGEVK